jgi:hypothetical protein
MGKIAETVKIVKKVDSDQLASLLYQSKKRSFCSVGYRH